MHLCMLRSALKRAECSFQLFGSMRELRKKCGVVGRCFWSIEHTRGVRECGRSPV